MRVTATGIDRLGVVGFTYRELSGQLRGRLSFDEPWCERLVQQLRAADLADGVAFVGTCNRNEVIVSSRHPGYALELVRAELLRAVGCGGAPGIEPVRWTGPAAVRHVLRVAASLDSLAVGEREIAGQLRRAFDRGRRRGQLDKPLNGLIHEALATARRVHAVANLAVNGAGLFVLAQRLLQSRLSKGGRRPTVAVVGLGDIGLRTARRLLSSQAYDMVLTSRTPRAPEALGARLGACPVVPWAGRARLWAEADAVVLATGAASPVLDSDDVAAVRPPDRAPLCVVDLGIPPQLSISSNADRVEVFDVDWFARTRFGLDPAAREALWRAESEVERGLARLDRWLRVRDHSAVFGTCIDVAQTYKNERIPHIVEQVGAALDPAARRALRSALHDLLTEYSESLITQLTRELTSTTGEDRSTAVAPSAATGIETEIGIGTVAPVDPRPVAALSTERMAEVPLRRAWGH